MTFEFYKWKNDVYLSNISNDLDVGIAMNCCCLFWKYIDEIFPVLK
jgi:hypothetical protein